MTGRRDVEATSDGDGTTTELSEAILVYAFGDPVFRAAALDTRHRLKIMKTLSDLRITRGFSQRHVAEMMNTTQSSISDIERGVVEPRLSTLQKFARKLGYKLRLSLEADSNVFYTNRRIDYHTTVRPASRPLPHPTVTSVQGRNIIAVDNVLEVDFRRREGTSLGGSLRKRLKPVAG